MVDLPNRDWSDLSRQELENLLDQYDREIDDDFDTIDQLVADGGQEGGNGEGPAQGPQYGPGDIVDALSQFVYDAEDGRINLDNDDTRAVLNKINEDVVSVVYATTGRDSSEVLDLTEGIGEISDRTLQGEIEYTGQYQEGGNGGGGSQGGQGSTDGGHVVPQPDGAAQPRHGPEQPQTLASVGPQYDAEAVTEELNEMWNSLQEELGEFNQQDAEYAMFVAAFDAPEAAYIAQTCQDAGVPLSALEWDDLNQGLQEFYQAETDFNPGHVEDVAAQRASDMYQAIEAMDAQY